MLYGNLKLANCNNIWRWCSFQVGFEMVDAIAEAEGISLSSVSFKALVGKGSICFEF